MVVHPLGQDIGGQTSPPGLERDPEFIAKSRWIDAAPSGKVEAVVDVRGVPDKGIESLEFLKRRIPGMGVFQRKIIVVSVIIRGEGKELPVDGTVFPLMVGKNIFKAG